MPKTDDINLLLKQTEESFKNESSESFDLTIYDGEKIGGQMRLWPDDVAVIPTEFTRACIFALIRRGRRAFLEWVTLESRNDIKIQYYGHQLDQADGDLWLACLRAGRGQPMGQRIYMTRASLLREIKRKDGKNVREWLRASLDRMSGATLRIKIKRKGVDINITSGLLKWGIEEHSGKMFIRLDPEGAALFDNLAYIDWESRLKLGSNTAKALQMYASGHQCGKPHSQSITNIMKWCGYEGRERQFRSTLIKALDELEEINFITNTRIYKGNQGYMVSWKRC